MNRIPIPVPQPEPSPPAASPGARTLPRRPSASGPPVAIRRMSSGGASDAAAPAADATRRESGSKASPTKPAAIAQLGPDADTQAYMASAKAAFLAREQSVKSATSSRPPASAVSRARPMSVSLS